MRRHFKQVRAVDIDVVYPGRCGVVKKVRGRRRVDKKRPGQGDLFPLKPITQLSFFIYSFMTFPQANSRESGRSRPDRRRHREEVRGRLSKGQVADTRVRSNGEMAANCGDRPARQTSKPDVFRREVLTEIVHHEINQPAMRDGQYRPGPFCGPDIGIDNPVSDFGPARRFFYGSIIADGGCGQCLENGLADNIEPVAAQKRARLVLNALRIGKRIVVGNAIHRHKLR
ncbi:hypothetical protein [Agrobacterium tumefaciens]|uniref:hypothetical protein n=1 Tax=Agrobacterium tumefaciens TaxID=358 RepID=UPI001571E004|nr:hypothetical protein [Agrobacterium tumefaciens]NTB04025.1 hypothetical protein [Agrobacterium tumefaciens]